MTLHKKEDTLYLANVTTTLFIFDIPRAEADFINWSQIEMLNNGVWTSGKYEGKKRNGSYTHVIVMMNKEPPEGVLSADRVVVVDVDQLMDR